MYLFINHSIYQSMQAYLYNSIDLLADPIVTTQYIIRYCRQQQFLFNSHLEADLSQQVLSKVASHSLHVS